MAVDVQAPGDPGCAASLIGYSALPDGDRALLTTAYPTNDREPQAVELDEAAQTAIAAAGPGKEVKDPLDYAPESHEVCANARFAISTNESARAELGLQAELKDALYKQAMLKKADDHTAASARVASAKRALEATTQSSELRPDKVTLSFNHTAMEWHFAYYFTNRSGLTASVACELPRLEGTTLANTFVTIDGYADESKYEPIKKAEETFKKLNASANKGACLQAVNKQAYAQTVKIPAWKGGDGPQVAATFSAHFVLSCDDVERKSHLLPKRDGEPTYECSDFAVQPPANDVPFELKIDPEAKHGATLGLPSRAAAKLDAERRGEPTYWLKPTGDDPCRIELTTPAMQPPCLRFRFMNESDSDFDFLTDLVSKADIATAHAQARVLCWAPAQNDAGVALVEVTAPKTLPDLKNAKGKTIHIVWVVDLSGSMGMRQNSSPHTNRHLACEEVKLACEKVLGLPKHFVEAGVASPNDTFLVSIVGFACSAVTISARVPVVTDSAKSKAAIDKAVDDLCASTYSGGTQYTSWAQLLNSTPRGEKVALCLLTDGALWDEGEFVHTYSALKAKVGDFAACAIGCGSWANHGTVKLVSTIENGEALITEVNAAVSSKSAQLLGKCLAATATKVPIAIDGRALSHTGMQALPEFATGPARRRDRVQGGPGRHVRVHGRLQARWRQGARARPPHRRRLRQPGARRRAGHGRAPATRPTCCATSTRSLPMPTSRTLKNPSHPKRVAELLEQIGVVNQCTTSYVTKITSYELGTKYDHALHPGVKAVVPSFKPPNADAEIGWLQQLLAAAGSATAKNGKTTYPHEPHCENEYSSHWGNDDGTQCMFRSLAADDSSNDDCRSAPVYRSMCAGADPEPMQTEAPAPAPTPGQKAEVEEPADPNATPKFSIMAKLVHAHALLKFLNDHTLAHRAVGSVLEELNTMRTNLKNANGAAGGNANDDDPMGDVVEALIDRVSGPSPKNVAAKIDALLQLLCSFAMRYHLPVDVNLHNAFHRRGRRRHGPAPRRVPDQDRRALARCAAAARAGALARRAQDRGRRFRQRDYQGVARVGRRGTTSARATIAPTPDPKEVAHNACYALACAFNEGAYKGGTFCSETMLFSGPKPAAFAGKEFKLSTPLVIGTHFNPWKHLHEPFKPQLVAAM